MQQLSRCLLPLALFGQLSAQYIVEGPEPNDFTGVPTPFACGSRAEGTLTPGDVDYYAVFLSPGHIKAYTSYGRMSTLLVDTIVEIHSAADALLALDDDSGPSLWSYVGYNVPVAGLYYVVVHGFAPATAGPYTLDLVCEPLPVILEGPEPNNLPGGVPTPAACGTICIGTIAPAADKDWWAVALTAPTALNITTGPGDGPGPVLVDTIVDLRDATLASIAFDDDGGEGLFSSISTPVLPPGLYFVDVGSFAGASVGSYSLRIGCGEPASVVADVLIPAGFPGCPGTAGVPAISRRASVGPAFTRVSPRIGTTFNVDVSSMPPGTALFRVLSLSLLPGPVALPGAPGCFLYISPDSVTLGFADATGFNAFALPIPNVMAFVGTPLYWQAFVVDPPANPLGLTASNIASSLIGNIAFP